MNRERERKNHLHCVTVLEMVQIKLLVEYSLPKKSNLIRMVQTKIKKKNRKRRESNPQELPQTISNCFYLPYVDFSFLKRRLMIIIKTLVFLYYFKNG